MAYHHLTATNMVAFFVSKGGKVMGAPQIAYLVLMGLSMGVSIADHGKTEVKKENCVTTLIAIAIQFGILFWGGFFG